MNESLTDHEKSCLLQVAAALQNELNEALASGNAAYILKLSQMIFGDSSDVTKQIDWIVPESERLLPNLGVTIFTLDGEVRHAFANSKAVHVEFVPLEDEAVGNEEHLLKLQDNVARNNRYGWHELSIRDTLGLEDEDDELELWDEDFVDERAVIGSPDYDHKATMGYLVSELNDKGVPFPKIADHIEEHILNATQTVSDTSSTVGDEELV